MTTDLQATFDAAVQASRTLPEAPDQRTLLQLYALYKQATQGDAAGERPALTEFVARAKWDAWQALAGQSMERAMQAYVDLVGALQD